MASQRIDLSNGMIDYTLPWTLTALDDRDLTAFVAGVRLSLGDDDAHGVWVTPDVISQPALNKITAQLLVGGGGNGDLTPEPGTYRLWRTISPNPQVLPVATPLQVIII